MGEWKSLKTDSGTGWKDIYREAGTGWKALDWEGVPIDVGGACINRGNHQTGANMTFIDKNNPSNAAGTLTNVCFYAYAVTAVDIYVGIFYLISGTTYKCRSAANLGQLSVGTNNEAVSLTIETGDVIGWFSGSNAIDRSASGDGYLYNSGNGCVVDNQSTYTLLADRTMSLYGTG